ncbi:MAG: thiol-disulfide oxidoreductase DCC family protein [Caldilineaceae bacterium]
MPAESVVLFDGVCNLCNATVQFIIKHDAQRRFKFAALQSAAADQLLKQQPQLTSALESVILVEDGKIYTESDAALHIARRLNGVWSLFFFLIFVPRWLRDPVYRFIARNRYRWFGKQDSCMIPTPELRSRFLDDAR